jgi:hypothetical protein
MIDQRGGTLRPFGKVKELEYGNQRNTTIWLL